MRRLENNDEEKFWEAWVKDAVFYFRFGKIGTQGQTKLKKFKTDAEAEAELEEKLREKLKQGFTEGDGSEEEEAEEREEDEGGSARNPELEARILENSDDTSSYLVYADWLSERGDPRGELIVVQSKLAQHPTPALKAQETKLLHDHGATWLGSFASAKEVDAAALWRLGFIDSFRLGPVDGYETSDLDFPTALEELLGLPGIQLLRELIIGSKSYDDYPTSWADCVEALAEHGVPAGLRRLQLTRGGYWDISSTELGSIEALYPHLKRLQHLSIEMGSMEFGKMRLPELRSLEVITGGLTAENLRSIGGAEWPHLEKLLLYTGETGNEYGCDIQLEDILALVRSGACKHVRYLGFANSTLADQIAAELPRTGILAQLETLDLSQGTFGDDGANAILENADAYRHLKTIDLTHHFVSDELSLRLAKLGPNVILEEGGGSDEPDDRYVAVSE
jgi:uncharacterized protein (TIGR02996 family)